MSLARSRATRACSRARQFHPPVVGDVVDELLDLPLHRLGRHGRGGGGIDLLEHQFAQADRGRRGGCVGVARDLGQRRARRCGLGFRGGGRRGGADRLGAQDLALAKGFHLPNNLLTSDFLGSVRMPAISRTIGARLSAQRRQRRQRRHALVDRLDHALAEIGDQNVGRCAETLDDRGQRQAACVVVPVQHGKDPILAGDAVTTPRSALALRRPVTSASSSTSTWRD